MKASSQGKRWRSIYGSVQLEQSFDGVLAPQHDHLLFLYRKSAVSIESSFQTDDDKSSVKAGTILIVPRGDKARVQLAGAAETLHIYVRSSVIKEVSAELSDTLPENIVVQLTLAEDPILAALMEAVAIAFHDTCGGADGYVDSLGRAISAQIIRKYSTAIINTGSSSVIAERLPPELALAVELLLNNLERTINLSDLSSFTKASPSHLNRLFRAEFGSSPHQYLIKLRVERASMLLKKTDMPISEIASACGFSHQEHMTRLFGRLTGTTPAAYRRANRRPYTPAWPR